MDDQRKDHIDPKGSKQWNRSKQQQSYNLPTNNAENINSTSKGRDLQFADKLRFVSWGVERMLQRIQRHSSVLLDRSAHPKWDQNQMETYTDGLDWR